MDLNSIVSDSPAPIRSSIDAGGCGLRSPHKVANPTVAGEGQAQVRARFGDRHRGGEKLLTALRNHPSSGVTRTAADLYCIGSSGQSVSVTQNWRLWTYSRMVTLTLYVRSCLDTCPGRRSDSSSRRPRCCGGRCVRPVGFPRRAFGKARIFGVDLIRCRILPYMKSRRRAARAAGPAHAWPHPAKTPQVRRAHTALSTNSVREHLPCPTYPAIGHSLNSAIRAVVDTIGCAWPPPT